MVILVFSHELHWRLDFIRVSGTEMALRGDFMEIFSSLLHLFHSLRHKSCLRATLHLSSALKPPLEINIAYFNSHQQCGFARQWSKAKP